MDKFGKKVYFLYFCAIFLTLYIFFVQVYSNFAASINKICEIMDRITPKQKLADILLEINIAKIASRYFGESSTWLYNKFDGCDKKGQEANFTSEELQQLKSALIDLSQRIKTATNTL